MAAMPAHATLTGSQVAVAAAGSDTTEKVMGAIATNLNSGGGVSVGGVPLKVYNIPTNPGAGGFVVDGGGADAAACAADVTWTLDTAAPASSTTPTKGIAPFGSGAGKAYLVAEGAGTVVNQPAAQKGCIDVGRSSSARGGSDPTSLEFYAFAMDAVSWATTSLKAPSALTQAQLVGIFDCTITDWGSLPGGTPGPIQRYYPNFGSGTRSFFSTDILGKPASPAYSPPLASTVAGCPSDAVLVEENKGTTVLDADVDKAIMPYSAAVWSYQESNRINPTVDVRKSAHLGAITTASPAPVVTASPIAWNGIDVNYALDTAGVVLETNVKVVTSAPNFPGIRYVYNILDNAGSLPGYQGAFGLYGFQNAGSGTKGILCDGITGGAKSQFARGAITSFGFAALSNTGPDASKNLAGSTCRKY